ncbi:MAG: TlpA family protein disulfide reductase [Flavobacteriales bacterium]|jgi:thiol-disulfide isomerase/thioredoxin|nr:TlpA family protein disulfide reductase [Flavobacteriales bacterium]MDP4717710.1 TlpA family protein disulfide reductase [Flavobacteriales bacterium]MDP4730741.1 TlpA family protein disulfide reductase [Flavobacteriales bacterium]MDP4818963.1 TlpA family protein disulfide reductase [Flavobacteriales bacterium]MDP4950965.1 TlpA family protein disulfide reductase [Flavobacteriales bacterium]
MEGFYSRKFLGVLSVERLLWAALVIAGVFMFLRYKTVPSLEQDSIIVTDTSGVQHKLAELTSGSTVVHFYASWCGPCLRELPEIKAFMETPLGRQINFVFITEDRADQVKTFHDRYGFNIYRVNKLKDANVYSIPVTYLLNEKHEIVKSDLGSWDWNQENLKNEISTLIK